MMLAEMQRTIPTLCGLPLQLAIDASLTSNVEFKAKLNLVDLLHQRPHADALVRHWIFSGTQGERVGKFMNSIPMSFQLDYI